MIFDSFSVDDDDVKEDHHHFLSVFLMTKYSY